MLSHHFERLNAVGDSIPARRVHVHLGNAVLALFHDPVFEHERGNPSLLQSARHVIPFQIDGQGDESATRRDDDTGSRGLGAFRQVGRQRGGDDVEHHRSERGVLHLPFLLGPCLGPRSNPRPDV